MTYADSPCTALKGQTDEAASHNALVTGAQLRIGHAKRNAKDVLDALDGQRRPDEQLRTSRMMAVQAERVSERNWPTNAPAFQPTMNNPPTIWTQTCRPFWSIAPPPVDSANAAVPSAVANKPVHVSLEH